MTQEQFDRWKAFSLAMARRYPKATERRRGRLAEEVESFFDAFAWDCKDDLPRIRSWDQTDSREGSDGRRRFGPCVCDYATEFFDEFDHRFGWNGGSRDREEPGRFYTQLKCCVRSGIDIAAEPSMGVIGFTAGDVRQIFDGEPPAWVTTGWNRPWGEIPDEAGVLL